MRKILFLLLLSGTSFPLFSQFVLEGKISDSRGDAVAGAVISIDGTFLAATSSAEGEYKIGGLKTADVYVTVRLLGYLPQNRRVDLAKSPKQDFVLETQSYLADEVVISATRADERSAMAYTTLNKQEIKEKNFGQDMPFLLSTQPSVVVNSDAGTGVGYTGIRVRGSDPTRINVTVNGIPINDAESHGLYWVNMPDFASSVSSIQLQRGVGTSTNGAGAFGATLNMQTNDFNGKAYGRYTGTAGSFGTLRNTFEAGTGLINGFTFDMRLSKIQSNGYIDRASSDLRSYFMSGAWYKGKTSIRANVFSGKEKTYQAWYGVPQDSLGSNRTYNPAGVYYDGNGNEQFYNNETDNYQQDHYQLFLNHEKKDWLFNFALHYTRGRGYYEQFKQADDLEGYGIDPVYVGSQTIISGSDTLIVPADTISNADIVRQLWLDNHFYGTVFSATWTPNNRLRLILGGGANRYEGSHYGEIVRASAGLSGPDPFRYYENEAVKTDANVYLKANYALGTKLDFFADLQYRNVNYSFLGYNLLLQNVQQDVQLGFFNPKAGLTYSISERHHVFASWAMGNREPVRDDFTNSTPANRPEPEQMQDLELGYRFAGKKLKAGVTIYNMQYRNQLVLTGAINNVGAYIRTNIPDSYRRGLELETQWSISKYFEFSGNLALSENKIKAFTEFVDDYDNGGQVATQFSNTDISFSPSVIGSGILAFRPMKGVSLQWIARYVSKQYLDNTQSDDRSLNAFFVNDFRFNWELFFPKVPKVDIGIQVNNVFSTLYAPNGYTYSGLSGGQRYDYNYYFPMADVNFLAMLRLSF
ncbi:MAG: TonB-dependent receptor [Bacteroidia bacterium]